MLRRLHSTPCMPIFLLAGAPEIPIIYQVERIRDGKSFATRRVVAIQRGHAIFFMSASFQRTEPGLSHQFKMPEVAVPEELPKESDLRKNILPQMAAPVRAYFEREHAIELRPVEFDRYLGRTDPEGRFHLWIRTTRPLPDDLVIHQCVLAYASDMILPTPQ